ncbi:MAG: ABC transporter permease [Candidatus Woesearchaeota archaeon]
MRLRISFKLALNILLHSRLRSWLTIIGIVIGVGAIVGIVSIGEGASASVQQRLGGLGQDIFTVSPGFSRAQGAFGGLDRGGGNGILTKNLTQQDIQAIKTTPGVLYVNGIISGRATVNYLTQTTNAQVQGVDPNSWQYITTSKIDTGRFLQSGDTNVVVLSNGIATNTFKQQVGINRPIMIQGKVFKVVGILQSSSGGFGAGGGGGNTIYMPIVTARTTLQDVGQTEFDSIQVKVENSDFVDQVANETTIRLLMERHLTTRTQDFTVTSSLDVQQTIQSVTATFTLFLAAIAAVSLIVGAVGIANTMFTSVLEKTKEIGIMKAVGAKNRDVMLIFVLNSGLVGLAGGLLGILLGVAISLVLPQLLGGLGVGGIGGSGGLVTVVPISLLVEALTMSIGIGMIAGIVPAYRASKLKPVDALRYE